MSCPNYKFRQGDFYCLKKEDYVNSDTYYRYCRNYSYEECPIYKHEESSGCYLTTIVCQVLGKKDNDIVLNTLRNFRDNILQKDENNQDILKDYDMIGPSIAKSISSDKDKETLATGLYNGALSTICKQVKEKNYEKAIETYYVMTLALINYYGLKHQYNNLDKSNYNVSPNLRGHARVLSPSN